MVERSPCLELRVWRCGRQGLRRNNESTEAYKPAEGVLCANAWAIAPHKRHGRLGIYWRPAPLHWYSSSPPPHFFWAWFRFHVFGAISVTSFFRVSVGNGLAVVVRVRFAHSTGSRCLWSVACAIASSSLAPSFRFPLHCAVCAFRCPVGL